ncbi:MAG: DUF4235 domain-containing protein [Mycobacteriales bacterium]
MIATLYKPWSLLFGVLGGLLASRLFTAVWTAVSKQEVPEATARDTSWAKLLPAAALEGAVYAGVKAAARRSSAQAFAAGTGVWPGEEHTPPAKGTSKAGRNKPGRTRTSA